MRRLAFLILLAAVAVPALAQDDKPDVDGLVESLGSDDWATRERATRKLIGLGDDAREALQKAVRDDDPEVRVRASRALISIGEKFGYAVECATSDDDRLREHGRAALMNLFRVDDPKVLRELNQQELQSRSRGWSSQFNLTAPPAIALARLQAVTGFRLLVADDAREHWKRVLQSPNVRITISGDVSQVAFVRDGVQRFLQQTQGNVSPEDRLVPRPMRVGRHVFLYVTIDGSSTNVARRCGEQLVADLLDDGERSVHAAALLARGAAGDSKASERIREQYIANPELNRLMWLALGLGESPEVIEQVRAREHTGAVELLASRDWTVVELAAKYLGSLAPEVRGGLLSACIATSKDSLELTSALWVAQGSPLSVAARERIGRLVRSKQDALAAAAARWFAGAEDVTDDELRLIWKAGEYQPVGSSFFEATLGLVSRPSVAGRITDLARESLKGIFPTQQALAAAVLAGRATGEDRVVALEKLTGAQGFVRLKIQLAELFVGCSELPEDGLTRFISGLTSNDAGVRGMYELVLRRCDAGLRVKIARAVLDDNGEVEDLTKPSKENFVRLAMMGILAQTGDGGALDALIEAVSGDEAEVAKAAGAAYVNAFEGDALFTALATLKDDESTTHGQLAALEGYKEICRRAADEQDRALFRKAYGIATNMQIINQNWQLRNELMRLQSEFDSIGSNQEDEGYLPADPDLKQLQVEVE